MAVEIDRRRGAVQGEEDRQVGPIGEGVAIRVGKRPGAHGERVPEAMPDVEDDPRTGSERRERALPALGQRSGIVAAPLVEPHRGHRRREEMAHLLGHRCAIERLEELLGEEDGRGGKGRDSRCAPRIDAHLVRDLPLDERMRLGAGGERRAPEEEIRDEIHLGLRARRRPHPHPRSRCRRAPRSRDRRGSAPVPRRSRRKPHSAPGSLPNRRRGAPKRSPLRRAAARKARIRAARSTSPSPAYSPSIHSTVRTSARCPSRVRKSASRSSSGASSALVTITTSTGPPSRVGGRMPAAGGAECQAIWRSASPRVRPIALS